MIIQIFRTFCKLFVFIFAATVHNLSYACQSNVTLTIKSSNYAGPILVELRKGRRPGSEILAKDIIDTQGTNRFKKICPGTYFFAFATPNDDTVSVTRYFDVTEDEDSYSNQTITVTYARLSTDGQRVGSAKRKEL